MTSTEFEWLIVSIVNREEASRLSICLRTKYQLLIADYEHLHSILGSTPLPCTLKLFIASPSAYASISCFPATASSYASSASSAAAALRSSALPVGTLASEAPPSMLRKTHHQRQKWLLGLHPYLPDS
jgi:hypothetical protein